MAASMDAVIKVRYWRTSFHLCIVFVGKFIVDVIYANLDRRVTLGK